MAPSTRKAAATKAAAPKPSDELKVTETTSGKTFAEVAESFTEAHGRGYIGTSAEAERTGKPDKGLSQQSPGILDGSSPAPDARKHVDDAEALAALKAGTSVGSDEGDAEAKD